MSKYFIFQSTHLAVEELRKPRMGLRRHVHHPQEILTNCIVHELHNFIGSLHVCTSQLYLFLKGMTL